MEKINSNLWKFSGIALIFTSAIFFVAVKYWSLLSHQTIYYCRSFLAGNFLNVPPILHMSLVAILFVLILTTLIKVFFVYLQSYKFKRHLMRRYSKDTRLNLILKELNLFKKVTVIKDSKPFAFCLGIRNPQIYISTGTLKIMSNTELKGILLHEKYHLQKKDGLVMLIASLSKILFPFLPIISDLTRHYRLEREIKADQEVISEIGKEPIISVLTKLLTFPSMPMLTASAIADFDTVKSRIVALNEENFSKTKYKRFNIAISFVSLIVFAIFIITPVEATEMHVNNTDTMMLCVNNEECAALCKKNSTMVNKKINYSTSNINASFPYGSAN